MRFIRRGLPCLWLVLGCAPASSAPAAPAASPATSEAPVASFSTVDRAPLPPETYLIRFEMRAREKGVRDLALVVEGLGIDEVVDQIKAGHRCELRSRGDGRSNGAARVRCGLASGAWVQWEEGTMEFSSASGEQGKIRTVPLVAGVPVVVESILTDPASNRQCPPSSEPARPLPLQVQARELDDAEHSLGDQQLSLQITDLGFSYEMSTHWFESCVGGFDQKNQVYTLKCEIGLHSDVFEVKTLGDALLFRFEKRDLMQEKKRDFTKKTPPSSFAHLGGFELPCGAKVVFPDFVKIAKDRACLSRCTEAYLQCDQRCEKMQARDERCGKACKSFEKQCSKKCR